MQSLIVIATQEHRDRVESIVSDTSPPQLHIATTTRRFHDTSSFPQHVVSTTRRFHDTPFPRHVVSRTGRFHGTSLLRHEITEGGRWRGRGRSRGGEEEGGRWGGDGEEMGRSVTFLSLVSSFFRISHESCGACMGSVSLCYNITATEPGSCRRLLVEPRESLRRDCLKRTSCV